MKHNKIINKMSLIHAIGILIAIIITVDSCAVSQKVSSKTGAQLWAENCQHCHNAPSPTSFSQDQWTTIGMHMQTRALITEQERDKIVEFLQSAAN